MPGDRDDILSELFDQLSEQERSRKSDTATILLAYKAEKEAYENAVAAVEHAVAAKRERMIAEFELSQATKVGEELSSAYQAYRKSVDPLNRSIGNCRKFVDAAVSPQRWQPAKLVAVVLLLLLLASSA